MSGIDPVRAVLPCIDVPSLNVTGTILEAVNAIEVILSDFDPVEGETIVLSPDELREIGAILTYGVDTGIEG